MRSSVKNSVKTSPQKESRYKTTPSQFFKPESTIMTRNDTCKLNFLRERAYVQGSLKSNFDFGKSNLADVPEEKYHIRVKNQIKDVDNENILRDNKLADKRNTYIRDYAPNSTKAITVNKCFNSSELMSCMNHDVAEKKNMKNSGGSVPTSFNNSKVVNKINQTSVNVLKDQAREFNKKGNMTLNSHGMKMSLLG